MAHLDWKVDDKIVVCASINDFCGGVTECLYLDEIDISKDPDPCVVTGHSPYCLDISGIEITFKLVGEYSQTGSGCNTANPEIVYKTIGKANTDSNGIATIEYTVKTDDISSYQDAISKDGRSLRILAYMSDSRGQPTGCNPIGKCSEPITVEEGVLDYNCVLNLYVKPYSWYNLDDASTEILKKLNDINGAIINFFADYTGYEYKRTEIFVDYDKNRVVIQIKFNEIEMPSPVTPAATIVIGSNVIILILAIIIIILAIGLIDGWNIKEIISGDIIEKDYTPKEMDNDLIDPLLSDNCEEKCLKEYPNARTDKQEAIDYAKCVKVCRSAVLEGVSDFFDGKGNYLEQKEISDDKIDRIITMLENDEITPEQAVELIDQLGDDLAENTKPPSGIDLEKILTYGLIGLGGIIILSNITKR